MIYIVHQKMTTYFISGHTNLTAEEFNMHYKDKIVEKVKEGSRFLIGDSRGADFLARKFLRGYSEVIIYHVGSKPKGLTYDFKIKSGFEDDESRDIAMTNDSSEDILWIRPLDEYKKLLGNRYNPMHISNVVKNFLRRKEL